MSGKITDLGIRPLIMGILNITPDSFSDGGRFLAPDKAFNHAVSMIESGADIIDIGGESSRPGSEGVSVEEELSRVIPVIERLVAEYKTPISIDTVKSEVAEKALEAGACMINDISALGADEKIAAIAAGKDAYLVLMHMRGTPKNMQEDTDYDDIIGEISSFLADAARKAINAGVSKDKIIIDPGIGFGKSIDGNFMILKKLHRFLEIDHHLLVGASRKSFIGKTLDLEQDERLEGSLAAACYAVLNGADIVRVHDVVETRRALTILDKIVTA
ncbi:MAG: dihydropteroate synthase [candidate division Zixibacteria bacterium]